MQGLRFYRELAADHEHPFPHANQTKCRCFSRRRGVEPNPGILNAQIDTISSPTQSHSRFLSGTVLYDIAQGLLHNAKQAQVHVLRGVFWNVTELKLDTQVVLLGKSTAKPGDGCH